MTDTTDQTHPIDPAEPEGAEPETRSDPTLGVDGEEPGPVAEDPPLTPPDGPPEEPEPDPVCPTCGAHGAPGARFCEDCGAPMTGEPPAAADPDPPAAAGVAAGVHERPCVRCGGRVAPDGYCEECGAPAVSERDHYSVTASETVGGVCDRGVVHSRNEDALALDVVGGVTTIVVCDGVSSAPASDAASLAASEAALAVLASGAPGGGREITASGAARTSAWASLLVDAAHRANEAVASVPTTHEDDAPSCTYVAAVVDGPLVVVASVGDSRAYWLPDARRAVRMTVDDSWAQEMAELGVHVSQVRGSPNAHAITRWLGADAPELKPRNDTINVAGPGWLLLCSDGLWNYCEDDDALGELVRATAAEHPGGATEVAAALVEWANAQGGRDNVTVALARLGT